MKKIFAWFVLLIFSFVLAQERSVYINMVLLNKKTLQELESYYGTILDGNYWYDSTSGLWGMQGGPAQGQIMSGLVLGGSLQTDASNGSTKMFVNGRQLSTSEYGRFAAHLAIPSGHY